MTTITKEELPELIREEMLHSLRNVPAVRYQVIGIMTEVFAQRADLQAILERIDAQRADFNQRMDEMREDFNRRMAEFAERQEEHSRRLEEFAERQEEHSRRLEEHSRRLEEHSQRMDEFSRRMDEMREDFNRQFAEHSQRMDEFSRRMDEMREDFNRRFAEHSQRMDELREDFNRLSAQHSREIGDLSIYVQALGARWGILAEDAFRAGIAGILTEETGLKVERYLKMDTEGQVFGQPDQVEVDVVIHNGDYWLLEIKSSISRGDVSLFRRKIAFYEREERVKVRRSLIISPYFDPGAQEQARALGIETYTSAREVQAVS